MRSSTTQRGRPTRSRALAMVLVATWGAAGCDAAVDAEGPAAPRAPSGRVTRADGPAHADVLAGYTSYWRVVEAAAREANWQHEDLASVATGPALHALTRALYQWHRAGRRVTGSVRLRPRVAAASAGRATILDCQDASGWTVVGTRTTPAHGRTRVRAELTSEATPGKLTRTWKVRSLQVRLGESC